MLILCRETTFAPGEQERAGVATSYERACMGLIINDGCTSGGVNLIFGTKLLETVELTLCVMMLLLHLLTFYIEIRFLIRLGRFVRRVGVHAADIFLCELLLDATNERSELR